MFGVQIKEPVLSRNNKLTPIGNGSIGAQITLGLQTRLGLSVDLAFTKPYEFAVDGKLPDMPVTQSISSVWYIPPFSEGSICLWTSISQSYRATMLEGTYVG